MLTEEWRVFKDKLSRAEQSFASELRDTGNRWGHSEPFSADDTYRALDTMERLLTAVDATAEADAVRKLRRDAQQAAFASETRRAVQAVTGVEGHGLKPWREVIMPHQDVREREPARRGVRGGPVSTCRWATGRPEYVDPVEFFRRTYLTEGLRDLLTWTARRIGGDRNAPPVVNLQTNFGGGKTHSMLALWHLLSGTPLTSYPDELQKLLAGHPAAWPRGGSRWSGTTSRPGRARPRRTARRCRRCGASWPGSWGSRGRRGRGAAGVRDRGGRRRDPVQPGCGAR